MRSYTGSDIRVLLDEREEPLIPAAELLDEEHDDGFDGVCTQHDGCRVIS